MNYEFHPLANIFPLIEGQAFTELVSDIRANGVREPIWMYENQILDGRNRYRAAKEAGIGCEIRAYVGADPVAFVVSLNLHRRHLTESQRGMVAAKLANMKRTDTLTQNRSANLQNGMVSQSDAAKLLNVSTRSVAAAAKVLHDGSAELAQTVERGDVSVSAAAAVTSLPADQQSEIVNAGVSAIKDAAKVKRAHGRPKTGPKADAIRDGLKRADESSASTITTYARLLLTAIEAAEKFTIEERDLLEKIKSAI